MRSLSKVIKARHAEVIPPISNPSHANGNSSAKRHGESLGRFGSLSRAAAFIERGEIIRLAKAEASRLIEDAHQLAAQRLAQVAEKEARLEEAYKTAQIQGREAGYREGLKAGIEQGREQGLKQIHELLQKLEQIVVETERKQAEQLAQSEQDLVKLAVAIAEKILCRNLGETGIEEASAILKELLPKAEGTARATVRLNPSFLELFEDESTLASSFQGEPAVVLQADATLNFGDVAIETEWGLIDGRLQSRWQRIMDGLGLAETNGTRASLHAKDR